MKAIGGYFSLELPLCEVYHKDAIKLNTGRNCLEYILRARKYSKVYIPYYTCDAVLEPFHKLGIPHELYHIDFNLEISDVIQPKKGEAILYTNYFGLKSQYVEKLVNVYGSRIIIDNTQAFYARPIKGIDTFYSCRKFFGVPDGAYLYTDTKLDEEFFQDVSYARMAHLLKRIDISAEEGFADFIRADDNLSNQPIRRMSKLTERLMRSIDYDAIRQRRRDNFLRLHESLKETNQIHINLDKEVDVPMVYPYLTSCSDLRDYLIRSRIYIACYWPNVYKCTTGERKEYHLAKRMLPLPVDQRYDAMDMINIIYWVKKCY